MAKNLKTKTTKPTNQTFSFRAPTALSVQLVGDFTHWNERPVNLHKEAGGVWHAEVNVPPGQHHYRFIVDGQWTDDPEYDAGGKSLRRRKHGPRRGLICRKTPACPLHSARPSSEDWMGLNFHEVPVTLTAECRKETSP